LRKHFLVQPSPQRLRSFLFSAEKRKLAVPPIEASPIPPTSWRKMGVAVAEEELGKKVFITSFFIYLFSFFLILKKTLGSLEEARYPNQLIRGRNIKN